jgi:urease accessory protein
MILVTKKSGNIYLASNHARDIDVVLVEWHEVRKRILHKETKLGKAVTIKFLNENPDLKDGDILYEDEISVITVEIKPCECIVITPENMQQASSVCYEIGNRHLPLYYEDNELMVPYDVPLHNLLESLGYTLKVEERKLKHSFQTTLPPHLQLVITGSLSKNIQELTTLS